MGLHKVTNALEPEDSQKVNQSGGSAEVTSRSRPAPVSAGLGLALPLITSVPMLPVVLLATVLLSVFVPGFASVPNMQNITRGLAVTLIAAMGETMVLLIAGIDLSVGAAIGLASVCGAFSMRFTGSVVVGILVCLIIGVLIGAINGFGISRIGMPPFIMTFGMFLTARAIAFLLTEGRSVGRLPKAVLAGGRLKILSVPLVFLVALVVVIIVSFVLSRTVFGQSIYLIGSNVRAASFSGINVRRTTFLVYTIAGLLAGLAAFVFMMRLGSASPTAGDPLLLEIIGAVVLGGTALSGGEGGVVRTFTGALLVAMIIKSLEIMGAQFWDQMIVIGILIALGSAMGAWLSRRRTSESRRSAQKMEEDSEPSSV